METPPETEPLNKPGRLLLERSSGVLLHVTSLPSPYGIGDLGPAVADMLDLLVSGEQRWWQMLPIGPTGFGDSPYQSLSTMAGNPLLLSPDGLARDGYLTTDDLDQLEVPETSEVDFGGVIARKGQALERAAQTFRRDAAGGDHDRFLAFRDDAGPRWLDEYALFAALKQANNLRPWTQWHASLSARETEALSTARRHFRHEIETHQILQYLFFEQWDSVTRQAAEHNIGLVGDLPLYVAHDSADVWAHRELFALDDGGHPTAVAGVPPDYFSELGQRWGNPLYVWERHEASGFEWWARRLGHALSLFDVVRVDHFRGLAGYWEIPAEEATAVHGQWVDGPGDSFMDAMVGSLGQLPVIAEDLGVITDDVIALRTSNGLPGMRVAQFGFDDAPDTAIHDPTNYPVDVWGYSGTHDNDTTEGWFWRNNPEHDRDRLSLPARELLERFDELQVSWGLVGLVAESKAAVCVFPAQDLLSLGSESRMNLPGSTQDNWTWKLRVGQFAETALASLAKLTSASGRARRR